MQAPTVSTALLASLALILGAAAGEAAAADPASPAPATEVAAGTPGYGIPAPIFVVDPQSLSQERARNKVVDRVRDALGHAGVDSLYAPAATSELALREAAMEALRRNLDIKRSGLSKAIAERTLIEAQAVFDPVFVASAAATLTNSFRRVEHPDSKFKPATERVLLGQLDSKGVFRCTDKAAAVTQGADKGLACYVITLSPRTPVLTQQYTRERPAGYYPSTVDDANKPSPYKPRSDEVYTGTVSIFQQLPWGQSLNLGLSTTRRQTYYALNTLNGLGETYGTYYRPYFTSISIGTSLPLPYTKNFGPTAAADIRRDVSRHAIDAAELDVRTVVNSTLLQVDTLYWTLVGAVGRLDAAAESLKLAQTQRAAIQRLYDQQLVTESDKAQADSQVARILTSQQQIFGEYLSASEAMRRLLDSDEDAMLLPVGWQAVMKQPAGDLAEPDRVFNNPAYQRQGVGVRIASLVRTQRQAQTRPDLSGSVNVTMAETGTFGYADFTGSVSKAFTSRDQMVTAVSLLYQRPIGNRAAEAALAGADRSVNQQLLALRKVELSTRQDYDNARGALASARERVRIAERTVRLANETYQSSKAQQELGLVAAYETIARLSTLLDARTSLVQAQIDLRLAESRLLASVGALAERYGELTAQTGADQERLVLLRETGALQHFGGPL
jgi:outer membrane protein TolC